MTLKQTTARSFDIKHKNPNIKSCYFYIDRMTTDIKFGPKNILKSVEYVNNNYVLTFKDPCAKLISVTLGTDTPLFEPFLYCWNNEGAKIIYLAIGDSATLIKPDLKVHIMFQDSNLPSTGENT